MRQQPAFADTFHWVALLDPRDAWHGRVLQAAAQFRGRRIVTTEEVLVEVLAFFGAQPASVRRTVAAGVREILADATVEVVPQSHASFLAGLSLYEARPDKGYSMVDCISMHTMRERGLVEALTHDQHFEQEGFVRLFRE